MTTTLALCCGVWLPVAEAGTQPCFGFSAAGACGRLSSLVVIIAACSVPWLGQQCGHNFVQAPGPGAERAGSAQEAVHMASWEQGDVMSQLPLSR